MNSDAKTYHCPNCGGALSFGITSQSWDCKFCLSSFSLEQLEASDAPDSSADYLAGEGAANEEFGEGARAFSCASCGANIITDETTVATFCVFCRNPTIISARLKDQHKPNRLIPFKRSKEDAIRAFKELCKGKPFLPKAFRSEEHIKEMTGIYVPFWLFDAKVDAGFEGEGDVVSTWSDQNYRYVKTDTYDVKRAGHITMQGVPVDGSVKMDDGLMNALQPYNYDEMKPFAMQFLSGHFAEDYDVDASAAKPLADQRMKEGANNAIRATASFQSLRIKNQHSHMRDEKNEYVMLPVWILNTQFDGKLYTFAMNGQTGKIVGDLPLSTKRVFAWFAGLAAGLFLIFSTLGWMLS